MGRCSQKMRGLRKPLWAPHASRPAVWTSLLGLFTPGTLRSQRIPATPESPRWKAAEAVDCVPAFGGPLGSEQIMMAHHEPPIRLFGGRGTRRRFCIRVAKRVVANRK